MNTSVKALVGIVMIAVLGIAGYVGWSMQQKRAQQQAIVKLVGESTEALREALARTPTPELIARLEAAVQAAKAPRDRELADAAELYILGAREIARRRYDASRIAADAAEARKTLAAHMAHVNRSAGWYSDATRLKKSVEQLHADLGRTYKAIDELISTMPDAQKRLVGQVGAGQLLDRAAFEAARKQVQEAASAAAAELEKARQLQPR